MQDAPAALREHRRSFPGEEVAVAGVPMKASGGRRATVDVMTGLGLIVLGVLFIALLVSLFRPWDGSGRRRDDVRFENPPPRSRRPGDEHDADASHDGD